MTVDSPSTVTVMNLELEAGLAGGVGEGADAPVVEVAVAVEDDLVDPLREESLAIASPTFLAASVLCLVDAAADVLRERRSVRERRARRVVHDLGVDVLRAAEDA